jgi:hypothetical protein
MDVAICLNKAKLRFTSDKNCQVSTVLLQAEPRIRWISVQALKDNNSIYFLIVE